MTTSDVEKKLRSAEPEERRRAVGELASADESDWPRLLVRALGDPDWRVRKEAVIASRGFVASREVLDALVHVLGPGDDVGLRNAAVEALSAFGPAAVEALQKAMPKLDPDGRKLAAEALAGSGDPAALDVLETLLDDEPNVRAAAIDAIATVGAADVDRATVLLERCLVTDDTLAALGALEGLNRLGVSVAWAMLRPLLSVPVLREAALVAAALSGHTDAAAPLARALASAHGRMFRTLTGALATYVANEPSARKAARAALAQLDEATRRRLIDQVRSQTDDAEGRKSALLVVGALGTSDAADVVLDALSDDRFAAEAEQALDMLGPAAILALARRARTGSPHARAACVEQLGRLAEPSTLVIACQAITDATEDGAPEVVRAALSALAQIGDENTLGFAARWLAPSAPRSVRQAAQQALAASAERFPDAARALAREITPDSVDAAFAAVVISVLPDPAFETTADDAAFLAEAASNEHASIRRAAIEAIARFGAPAAVEAASFGVTDEAQEVQLAAIRALGRIRNAAGHPIGTARLLEVVKTFSDEGLAVAALEALGETGDPGALDVLRGVAREGGAMRAVAAVEAIGHIDAPGRVDALIIALSHGEPEVVKAALRTLSREEKDPRGAAHVAACLDHEAWDVRRLAAELLGRRSDPTTKHLLRQRLIGEQEPLVREEIQRTLAEAEGIPVRRTMPPLGGGSG
ncbi:MAG TPA: HEAT repeat domain-containing protein [Polyangiaceae bacterium]|nr:HEAT repeat domain-containing protein [Polyangiaceae bacterium]